MSFDGVLSEDRVLFLACDDKKSALQELIDKLALSPAIEDKAALTEGIFHRESLMSTGIGLGVGVPHVRLESVKKPVMAVGICHKALSDYESIDNQPVSIIFMIAAGENQHAEHLSILSALSRLCKDEGFRSELLAQTTSKSVYQLITGGKD